MTNAIKIWPLVLLMLVILTGAGCAAPKSVQNTAAPVSNFPAEKIEGLAQALTAAGAREYGSQFCSACKYQKEMFGDAWKFVTYVECATSDTNSAQNAACSAAKITLYPTWEFADGSRLQGVQQFSTLADKIGFDY